MTQTFKEERIKSLANSFEYKFILKLDADYENYLIKYEAESNLKECKIIIDKLNSIRRLNDSLKQIFNHNLKKEEGRLKSKITKSEIYKEYLSTDKDRVREETQDVQTITFKKLTDFFIILGAFIVLILLLNHIFLLGHKMKKVSYEEKLKNDKRLPVLYLRAFFNDFKIHKQFSDIGDVYEILKRDGSEEDQLTKTLDLVGPVVGLNSPGAFISQTGAARKLVENEKWKKEITYLIDESRLIVLYFSADDKGNLPEGLEWEIEEVFSRAHLQNIILIVKNTHARLFQTYLPKFKALLASKEVKSFKVFEEFLKEIYEYEVNKSNQAKTLGRLFWVNRKDELLAEELAMAHKNDEFIYKNELRKYPVGKEWQSMYLYALIPYFKENRIDYNPLIP